MTTLEFGIALFGAIVMLIGIGIVLEAALDFAIGKKDDDGRDR